MMNSMDSAPVLCVNPDGSSRFFCGRAYPWRSIPRVEVLRRFNHMSSLDAAGAHINFFNLSLVECSDPLQVGIETTFVNVVGMADIVSNHWFFSAYFTFFGHAYLSLDL